MKKLIISIALICLKLEYLIFRPLKVRNRVLIISRQANRPTLDIIMLSEKLKGKGIDVEIICKTLNRNPADIISFGIQTIRQVYHIAISKIIILDGYCIPACVLPKKQGQKIIQMWHALGAIKKFGWQSVENPDGHSTEVAEMMKMHNNYDYVLAPSEVTGGFFAEAFRKDVSQLVYIGLPRIDYIREDDINSRNEIEKMYPSIKEKTNVLYVPTFRKNAELEMESLINGFDFETFNLIIKKHFLDKGDYSWAKEKGAIVDESFSSLNWIRICRKIITDYSAIAFEAAIRDIELYIYQPDNMAYNEKTGTNVDLSKEAIGEYVSYTEEELFEQLKKPYDMTKLISFREKFISVNTENCTERLSDFVIKELNN